MNRLTLLRLASVVAFVVAVLLLLALLAPQPRARRPTLSIGLSGDRLLLLATRSGASTSPTAELPTLALSRPRDASPAGDDAETSAWSEIQKLVDSNGSIVPWPTPRDAQPHAGEVNGDVLIWYQETVAYHRAQTTPDARGRALPGALSVVRVDAEALFPAAFRQRYPRALLGDVAILTSGWEPARAPQTQTAPSGNADAGDDDGDAERGEDTVASGADDTGTAPATRAEAVEFPPLLLTYLVGDTFAFIVRFPDGSVGEYTPPLSVVPGMPPLERAPLPDDLRLYALPAGEVIDAADYDPAETGGSKPRSTSGAKRSANANRSANGNNDDRKPDLSAPQVHSLRVVPGPDGQLDVLYTVGKQDVLTWANVRLGARVPERHREMPIEVAVFAAARSARGVEVICIGEMTGRDKREWLSMVLTPDVSDRFSEIVRTPVFNGGGPPPASASAIALAVDGDTVRGAYLAFAQGYEFWYATDTDSGATHALNGPDSVRELNQLMNQPPHMMFIMAMTGLLAVTFVVFLMVRLRQRAQLAAARAAQLHGPPSDEPSAGTGTGIGTATPQPDRRDEGAPTSAPSDDAPRSAPSDDAPATDAAGTDSDAEPAAEPDADGDAPDPEAPDAKSPETAAEGKDENKDDKKEPLPYDASIEEIEERLGFLPAGLLLRVLALLIDFFILIPAIYLVGEAFKIRVDDFGLYFQGGPDSIAAHVILAIVHFCYFSAMEYYFGRSLGKMVCGIRVRDAQTKKAPTLRGILIRNALRVIDYYFFFLMIVFTEKQQRFGDLLGQTIVSRDKPKEQDQDFGF